MNKDTGNLEVGEVFQESYECEAITWKIPHVSSLDITKSTEIQSSRFYYKNATWILKILPCGWIGFDETFRTTIKMERIDSEIRDHNFYWAKSLKYQIDVENNDNYEFVKFNPHKKENFIFISSMNWKSMLFLNKNYRWKDMFFLVVKILTKKDSKTKSAEVNLGNINTDGDNSSKAFGELSTESFDVEMITWKIPKVSSLPTKVDYGVQTPSFSFADASWILKMFPYGQKKFQSERNIDIMIERAFSLLPKHCVSYKISFDAYDKQIDQKGYSLEKFFKKVDWDSSGSFVFETNSAQEHICYIDSYVDFFSLVASNKDSDTIFLICDFRIKKNAGVQTNVQTELAKSSVESCGNMSEKKPSPIGFTFGESCGNMSEKKSDPIGFSFGESCGNMSEKKTDPIGFSFGESCANMSEKKPVSIGFSFEASSGEKSEENTSSASSCKESFGKVPEQNPAKSPFSFTFGESSANVSGQKPVPSSFAFGGSPQIKLGQNTTSPLSSFKGSSQKKRTSSCLSSSKEASETQSDQKPTSGFNFNFKGFGTTSTFGNAAPATQSSGELFGSSSSAFGTPRSTFGGFGATSTGTGLFGQSTSTGTGLFGSSELSPTKSEQKPAPFTLSFKDCFVPRESVDLPNKKLLRDLKDLFLKQEDCDVVLNVKGQEFSAHRLILKARSPVFASTFRNAMKEKATGVVDIEDCDPSSFSDFLYFLYCGSTEKLSPENVFSLFTTADKYDVEDLRSECLKFIRKNLSIDTFCDTISLALQHSERELIELATQFFSKNLQKIILTVKWQSFLVENPIHANELLIKALTSNK